MLMQQIVGRVATWFANGREIQRLRDLDDHLLRDMGFKRREIARRVRGR